MGGGSKSDRKRRGYKFWWLTQRLSSLVREFGKVCERRKLKDNVRKSKVRLGSEELEEVSEFSLEIYGVHG